MLRGHVHALYVDPIVGVRDHLATLLEVSQHRNSITFARHSALGSDGLKDVAIA